MSVIIRLQNLPWSANALDIRQYFHGLSIPEGGVHIVGGELGDAFIAFSTDEDARQAMLVDGGKIKEVKIKLYLSSRTEMQKVIEMARAQTLNLQSFMQMSAPSILPQVSMVQSPVLPILNQMPTKVATPEVKTPLQPPSLPQPPVPQPSLLQPPPLLPQPLSQPSLPQTTVPQPTLSQAIVTTSVEKKNIPNQNSEMETKDMDAESISSRDRRDRRERQKSRSLSRDRSRDRSRERSKSRDRRDFRNRDRYRDRRRRDRSRSRDRRRRNRDRSRSRERSSRKNSRERRKDYDQKSSTNETDKNNTNKKSPSIEKKIVPQIPLPPVQKPGFKSSGWVTVNENKANVISKTQLPLMKPPVPPALPQSPKAVQSKSEINLNTSVDLDGIPPMTPDMFSMSNKLSSPLPENSVISRQTPMLQRRTDIYPPIMGLQNKDDTPNQHLSLENWSMNRPPPDLSRPPVLEKERLMPVNPFSNPSIDIMERRSGLPPNNTFRVEDGLNRASYLNQNSNENFQSMFQNKPDIRMQNNFNAPIERANYGADTLPIERDSYRPGPSLLDRSNFRQDLSSVDNTNYRPELKDVLKGPIERSGYRQEPLSERGNYRQELVNERGIQKQESTNERGNQRQETSNERGNYRQNTSIERGSFRQDTPIERGSFRQDTPIERGNFRQESVERGSRPFPTIDRFSQMERIERPSPYSQRQFNQRGKYNNSCVEVRNMSPSTAYSDLRRFFHGLFIPGDGIKIINDCQGNRIGIAYIRFSKPYCKEQALKKNGSYIKNTMVEVLHINDDLFDKAVDTPLFEGRNQLPDNRGHYDSPCQEEMSTDEFIALAIREFPPYTKEKDIQNIFSAWKLADCFLLPKSGRRNASAYVKFFTMEDARKALAATCRYMIGNRKIHVSICYDHEFQDARDIKNMEEDEDDRLVIDTKDETLIKTSEARSPPKDPRIESKANNNMRMAEQKKLLQPEPNKTEFQHLELQQGKVTPQPEQKIYDRKQPEPAQSEQKIYGLKQSVTVQPESTQSVSTPESSKPDSSQPATSQLYIGQPEKKESIQSFMEIEQNKPGISNTNSVDTSDQKNNSLVAREQTASRALLPTPDIRTNPNFMTPANEDDKFMDTVEFDQRKFKNATDCIIMRGLPYQANDRDIIDFFADEEVVPTQIHIMLDKAGHPAGDAFCEFSSPEEAEFALLKDNTLLGRSLISVLPVAREEMCEALGMPPSPDHQMSSPFPSRPPHTLGRGGMRGRYRPNFPPYPHPYEQQHRLPPLMGYDHRRDMMLKHRREEDFDRGPSVDAFGRPGCVIALENVPFKADVDEIIDFFRGFDITRENVIRRYNELGRPTGDARVALSSPLEAQRALKMLSFKQMRHRQIFMRLLS